MVKKLLGVLQRRITEFKKNETEFTNENVIRKKGDKLYAKWKGYDNSFNNWLDKKDIFT